MTKQLLTSFFDLYTLSNDISKWSIDYFANNPPRLYRLQVIQAIMNALQMNCSFQEFHYGEFLLHQENLNQKEFLRIVQENYPNLFSRISFDEKETIDFQFTFERLLQYRMQLQKLISSRDGIIEYSMSHSYPVAIIEEINTKLQVDIEAINSILAYLINPQEINLSIQELKEQYKYPEGDLQEIDINWF